MAKASHGSSSSRSEKGSSSRYASLSRSSNGDRATFSETLPGMLAAAVDTVIQDGDLLSLSRTSDGGAICVYVKSGADTFKAYAVTQDDLDQLVQKLAESS